MEHTSVPNARDIQSQLARNLVEAQRRFQSALAGAPNSIQPVMQPADVFFAPPAANPSLTTCLVCAAPFATHADLCKHVEMRHATLYNPAPAPVAAASPFAAPGSVFPFNSLQPPAEMVTDPWTTPVASSSAAATGPAAAFKPHSPHFCAICAISCDTPAQLTNHLAGQKHRKKAEWHTAFQDAAKTFESQGITEVSAKLWVCKLCRVGLDGENAVLQHLAASKHKRLREASPQKEPSKRGRVVAPLTALQAAESSPSPSAPVSAALAVLKDDNNVTLPPLSSLINTSMAPATRSAALAHLSSRPARQQPVLPVAQPPAQPGAPRAGISKSPRPATAGPKYTGPSFSCSICSVTCNSMDSLNAHLASARHKRKQNMLDAASNTGGGAPPDHSQSFRCNVCGVTCCGAPNYEAHLKGKPHAKKLRQQAQGIASAGQPAEGGAGRPQFVSPAATPPRANAAQPMIAPSVVNPEQMRPKNMQTTASASPNGVQTALRPPDTQATSKP